MRVAHPVPQQASVQGGLRERAFLPGARGPSRGQVTCVHFTLSMNDATHILVMYWMSDI